MMFDDLLLWYSIPLQRPFGMQQMKSARRLYSVVPLLCGATAGGLDVSTETLLHDALLVLRVALSVA